MKIVLIGGGTGSYTLLQELKNWSKDITAIVNMCDDGGSSGSLRDELGVLPPGDVRQCLVALSNHPETRDLFSYRFVNGTFSGHAVGNIILSALELQTGSFIKAVDIVAEFLQITGRVIPVSSDNYTLELIDGSTVIKGEKNVIKHKIRNQDAKIVLKPQPRLNPAAKKAIEEADLVIIAPGNLYGSLLPILAIEDMASTLKMTHSKIIMITNLVNKPGQTENWHVVDYLKQMERYIGIGTIDTVLYNTKLPGKELLKKYAEDKEYPPNIDQKEFKSIDTIFVGAPLVANKIHSPDPHDKMIRRTLIRHDALEVLRQLKNLTY